MRLYCKLGDNTIVTMAVYKVDTSNALYEIAGRLPEPIGVISSSPKIRLIPDDILPNKASVNISDSAELMASSQEQAVESEKPG
jgi:hypothetical protein